MQGLLDHRLLVVTGKGGTGKTTMAAAIALAAARRGRSVLVVELGEQSRLPGMFARRSQAPGVYTALAQGIESVTIDPDLALLEWLQALGGRVSGRLLAGSGTFQYFAAAAPGAKELVSMVKVNALVRERERRGRRRGGDGHDLVIVDAPATGHALGLLRSPQTFGAIARVGPIVRQTDEVDALLRDRRRTAYVAVTSASEMAIGEAIELEQGLRDALGRGLLGVLANALMPRRFSVQELDDLDGLAAGGKEDTPASAGPVLAATARAARAVHERANTEHNLLGRLRRRGFDVLTIPFQWVAELDVAALEEIATLIERGAGESGSK